VLDVRLDFADILSSGTPEPPLSSNTTRLLARNVLNLGLGQVATTALGIVSATVVGRALEPADFGVLYVVLAICSFFGFIADWGQGTNLVREVARDRADEPELIGSALVIRLVSTACATALAGAAALGLGYDERVVTLTLLAMLVAFPNIVSVPYSLTFRAKNQMGVDASAGVVGKGATLVATVVALHFGGGLRELILMQGVGAIASLLLILFFVARHNLRTKYPTPSAALDVFWGGLPVVAFSLVLASQSLLEALILSALATPAVVGWFGAARTILGIILSPALILVGASFPQFSRAAQSPAHLRSIFEGTSRVVLIIAAFSASFLYLFADHLIHIIYGHGRFRESADILRASAIFVPLLFLVMLLGSTLWAVGRNKILVAISIVRISFCTIANLFLISLFQERLGNGALGLVYIAGVAEIPALITFLAVLPREVVGYALLLKLTRAYLVVICVVVVGSLLQPLTLWYFVPAFALTFASVSMATRLVLPSDLHAAIDLARRRTFQR
jgi:O-antigen/teichoic acid export membrane protein